MKLAMGTVQFGLPYGISNSNGQTTLEEASRIIDLARISGVSLLDTAMAYGESESRLGQIGVDSFKVVTKLSELPEKCSDLKKWAREQIEGSLQKLCLKSLYGLLLHSPGQLLGSQSYSLFAALKDLKKCGLVEKIGISIYSPFELDDILPLFPVDLVQASFNLIDQRLIKSGWMRKLHADGIEIHVRSVFLQGLLLTPLDQIPSKFARWSFLWEKWHDWLSQTKISPQAACLSFVKSIPEIDQIIVGVETQQQFTEILDSMNSSIPTAFPHIECADLDLINPSYWSKF
jgi:aryl-alcohol dehydrogenase-like predicted oxidoreductase